MSMEPPPVPGYSIHQTPTGEFYYVNIETGESQWERPPPDHSQPPQTPMPTPSGQALPVMKEPMMGPDLKFAKGAIFLMFVSLFMPYITFGGIVEVTGIDIISESVEMAEAIMEIEPDELAGTGGECPYANDGECDEPFLCEEGTDGNDCGTSGSGGDIDLDVPFRFYMILIGSIMVLISPFFIILSGILSSVTVFSGGKLPKILGSIHLAFFAFLFLMLAIGGTVLDDLIGEAGISLVEFMGFGLWMGGLSGIGLIYEKS